MKTQEKNSKTKKPLTETQIITRMNDFIKKEIKKQFTSISEISYVFNYFKFTNEFSIRNSTSNSYYKMLTKDLNTVFDDFINYITDILMLILNIELLYPSLCKYIINDFILRVLKVNNIESFLLNANEPFKLIEKKNRRKAVKIFLRINEEFVKTIFRQKVNEDEV